MRLCLLFRAAGAPGSAQPRPTGTNGRPIVAATSLPRERMGEFQNEAAKYMAARNGEALAAQQQLLAAQQQQQQQLLMQQQQAAAAAVAAAEYQAGARQQGSIPGNPATMQQQQQLMAAMQQQQQQYHQQYQQLSPQEEEEAYRQQQQRKMAGQQQPMGVDNLGSHVSGMSVMDCHNSSAVQMGYHSYAQQNPIYRSSSYQVQSIHRL